jgi:hypothetical protein
LIDGSGEISVSPEWTVGDLFEPVAVRGEIKLRICEGDQSFGLRELTHGQRGVRQCDQADTFSKSFAEVIF